MKTNPITKAGRVLAGVAVLALGAVVVGCAVNEMAPEAKAQPQAVTPAPDVQQAPQPVRTPRQDAMTLRTSFADVVEPALESVVSIESTARPKQVRGQRQQQGQMQTPFGILPFPFGGGDDQQQSEPEDSFGSGVVVAKDGLILTNNHVVEGADEVRVRFHDNREMRAKVLGTDPLTDIAVLRVDAKDLPALPLGTSSDLRVGDLVFAIGSPFTLSQSVTMGIVSATGRNKIGITSGGYEDFIQTDAPINPGNSGGALLDSRGDVVGINTAIFTNGMSRGNQGIGFAVPVDMIKNVMDQIVRDGKVVRAQLGVRIKEVDAALAKSYGLNRPMGALVTSVENGSPAAEAGLKPEDLVVEIDGKNVQSDAQLRLDISSRKPGSKVELAVLRESGDGSYSKKTVDATLREMKDEDEAGKAGAGALEDTDNALRGIAVEDLSELSPAERRTLQLGDAQDGVVVTDVDPYSPAARAGLQQGDVITSMNRQDVASASDFRAMAKNLGKNVVRLHVQRGKMADIIAVEP